MQPWCPCLFDNTLTGWQEWQLHELPTEVKKIPFSEHSTTLNLSTNTSHFSTHLLYTILRSLHSRKLHILGFRARTVCTNSLVIFFFSLSDNGTYHFWSLSLPWRLNSSMNCIWNEEMKRWKRSWTHNWIRNTFFILRGNSIWVALILNTCNKK